MTVAALCLGVSFPVDGRNFQALSRLVATMVERSGCFGWCGGPSC